MRRDLLDLMKAGYGDASYVELFRRAGWDYKSKISLVKRDTLTFKHYYDFIRDVGAKLFIVDSNGISSEVDLGQEKTEAVDDICHKYHISKAEIGRMWGVDRATAWGRISRVSMTMDDMVRILNLAGATLNIKLGNGMIVYPVLGEDDVDWVIRRDEDNLETVVVETEVGKVHAPCLFYHGDMTKVSEGERYYTNRSIMISTFTDEDAKIVKDLFRSAEGHYFFAIYEIGTLEPIRMQAATLDDARLFVAGHGLV